MGIKQGLAMIQGAPQMLELFGGWGFPRPLVTVLGITTLLSGILIAIPRTFLWGNWLMASVIPLLICFHLAHAEFKGVLVELPFLALNLLIIYLGHPLATRSST